jgi:hypothetical protein
MNVSPRQQRVIDVLDFAFNGRSEKDYSFGIYDHEGRYVMSKLKVGTEFQDRLDLLNELGFNMYSVTSHDDKLYFVIQDRRWDKQ